MKASTKKRFAVNTWSADYLLPLQQISSKDDRRRLPLPCPLSVPTAHALIRHSGSLRDELNRELFNVIRYSCLRNARAPCVETSRISLFFIFCLQQWYSLASTLERHWYHTSPSPGAIKCVSDNGRLNEGISHLFEVVCGGVQMFPRPQSTDYYRWSFQPYPELVCYQICEPQRDYYVLSASKCNAEVLFFFQSIQDRMQQHLP